MAVNGEVWKRVAESFVAEKLFPATKTMFTDQNQEEKYSDAGSAVFGRDAKKEQGRHCRHDDKKYPVANQHEKCLF